MKKIIISLCLVTFGSLFSQKIGVNNKEPEATLDVHQPTSASNRTTMLRINNGVSNTLLVKGDGKLQMNVTNLNDTTKNHIYTYVVNRGLPDFGVGNGEHPEAFVAHFASVDKDAMLSDYGIDIGDRTGHLFLFSTGGNDDGFFIGGYTDRANGIYVGENGNNGIGAKEKPTEKLVIGGVLKISNLDRDGVSLNVAENDTCVKPGQIVYNANAFWGCTNNGWRQLDN
ncbi:hypothetical protein [Riemerella columbina]|uniref:hypothetical protein n=1 Tax=Riemerella columbina TaxID=103810 RepID=UPI00266ECE69|nr:hypothetical protein [Riemerella columbina]WKS94915.1 hypothetical protein NYR17_08295 [Riemerella columbina]